jgi:hypothetical protein
MASGQPEGLRLGASTSSRGGSVETPGESGVHSGVPLRSFSQSGLAVPRPKRTQQSVLGFATVSAAGNGCGDEPCR